jgi:hypothetical protein
MDILGIGIRLITGTSIYCQTVHHSGCYYYIQCIFVCVLVDCRLSMYPYGLNKGFLISLSPPPPSPPISRTDPLIAFKCNACPYTETVSFSQTFSRKTCSTRRVKIFDLCLVIYIAACSIFDPISLPSR